ncbi:alginate export family protein [bacterium]|nr:alginate export family protein [bacterium]
MRLETGRLLLLLILVGLASTAFADIPINERVSIDGNLRFRGFIDDRDFDSVNTDPAYYATMRTMIGFKIQATDDVLFRAKIRDSRYVGVPYTNTVPGGADATTVNTQSSSQLELQEGYLFANDILGTRLDLQIGRFEMEYGRGRLLGASGWNVAGPRAYDGFRFMWHKPGFQLDVFASIIRDYSFGTIWPNYRPPNGWVGGIYQYSENAGYNEQKRYLAGVAASFMDGALQPLLLIDYDTFDNTYTYESGDWVPGTIAAQKEQEFWITPALYTNFTFSEDGGSRWELEGDFAAQMGATNDNGAYPDSYSLLSFLAALEVRVHGNDNSEPFVGIGADYTGVGEGDGDPQDVYVFYQDYYTQHAFRGAMDYFWNVNNGLIDGFITFGATPTDWLCLKADIHNFSFATSQGRVRPNGKVENLKQLGQELDLLAGFKIKKGFRLDAGYNMFFPTQEFAMRLNQTVYTPGVPNQSDAFSYYAYLVFTTMF